ncbi:MAG: hypothetical protein LBG11_09350 [Bifidobacteriaceae bacterium]|jgi:hypothetical protein|nr:hypothetical protein [Bifidobacteriaceae bacterium]
MAFAGLPSLPRQLAEAKSYAERLFTYHPVDALPPAAAAALALPAQGEGVTWERATKAERRHLRAMADNGDEPSSSGAVARRPGKDPGRVSAVRAQLIAKGLFHAPATGEVAFTVPMTAAFITRQPAPE